MTTITATEEQRVLDQVPKQLYIAGDWRDGSQGTIPVEDPATGETLVEVADASVDDAKAALDAAVEAGPSWAQHPPRERGEILRRAFEDRSFHVHVPAGAIPKDGPSAGVTMVTALASLLSGRPVKHTVGMTGEVTLQGRVLPIGGVKQKVLAAHAAGLTDVVLPERNRGDLDDVPADVREQLAFHPVMSLDEVLEQALEPARDVAAV